MNKSYDFSTSKISASLIKRNEIKSDKEYPTTIEELSVKDVRFINEPQSKTAGSQVVSRESGTSPYNSNYSLIIFDFENLN